jgi:N-acetylmuramoyl-L-alanine amidase
MGFRTALMLGGAWWLLVAAPVGAREPVRVVLDPGHGGSVGGAVGADGTAEKAIALDLAFRLKSLLEQDGRIQVTLTREKDRYLPLAERVQVANRVRPDLFVSIHANSMPTPARRARNEGVETFFLSANASGEEARRLADRENAELPSAPRSRGSNPLAFILSDLARSEAHADSSRAAYALQKSLIAATGAVDRGVQQAPFFVLSGVEAPAVLVEVGFISHPAESRRLAEPLYRENLAQALARGISSFLEGTRRLDKGG